MFRLSNMLLLPTALLILILPEQSESFATNARNGIQAAWGLLHKPQGLSLSATTVDQDVTTANLGLGKSETNGPLEMQAVRAPLKFVGPYPTVALHFPKLSTASQRERNVSGISLDFIVDTAANTNTINAGVAQELDLTIVGAALPGVGAAGAMQGGSTFLLGDTELEGLEEKFTFMTGLTASALPVASPATAGLLSLAFLQSFEGVEFQWTASEDGNAPPSITFLGDDLSESALEGRVRIPIQRVPITQLPTVTIEVNGVKMPALLDTGSPVTVLNAQAAKQAGLETTPLEDEKSSNPFAAIAGRFQQNQAAARGDVLAIQGVDGQRVNLVKTVEPVNVHLSGGNDRVDFGKGFLYVGDLPGLAALNGIGVESPPAVVLGMDVLRRLPKMLLKLQKNEVWF